MLDAAPPRGADKRETHRSYVMIACAPYSGSTLLASLLGEHPEIATVSEVSGTQRARQMDRFRCSCQRLMVECPFWQEVEGRARAAGIEDFALGDFRLRFDNPGLLGRVRTGSLRSTTAEDIRDAVLRLVPSHERSLRKLGQRNRAFAHVILDATDKRVFVDASKEGMRLRYLRRYLGMQLKVVHLVRDVRGVVASSRKRHEDVDVASAAKGWARTNATLMRHLEGLDPRARTLLRYEDLCRDPDGTLAALHAFMAVTPVGASVPSDANRSQHLLGNRARLRSMTEIRLDEQWRSSLSSDERATIMDASAPIFRSLYPMAVDLSA